MTATSTTLRLARRLCAEFDLGEPTGLERVARGAVGAVHRLEVGDGPARCYAVKQLFWDVPTEAAARREVEFRDACALAGIPSPRPLRTRDGALLVHDQDSDTVYRLYEWVDGAAAQPTDPSITTTMASWMGTMHALALPVPTDLPIDSWYLVVEADWPELVLRSRRGNLADVDRLEALLPRLIELSGFVNQAPGQDPVWCHRDWQPGNVINAPTSPVLVDWDNSGPLDPAQELAGLAMGLPDDPVQVRELLTAYRRAGGTAVITGPTCFATSLASMLNYLTVQLQAQLDSAIPEHREFGARAVANVVRTLPTLGQLDQLARTLAADVTA